MKTNLIKTFALVAALVGSSFAFAEDQGWNINDSVVIKPEVKHYLTGEEPSQWVYGKTFGIQQIGSKRFENGILLAGIVSWVGPDDITRPDGTSASAGAARGKKADNDKAAGPDKNADKHYDFGDWRVGDTIMIKRSTTHYLTGEEPSTWVYDKKHTIQTLGSKRFPNGVLVAGIISWVGPDDIYRPSGQPAHESKVENKPAKPETTKPATTKPETTKPETTKPETTKPETTKPETTKPETTKPETTKPETTKPETTKPETTKPEDTKPAPKTEAAPKDIRMQAHHRFSIGLRGGVASLMQEAPAIGNWKIGFDGLLDLQYAYYFGAKKKVNHGIITGLSAGYAQSPLKGAINDAYDRSSNDGNSTFDLHYTIKADELKEVDRQIQVEIPLMYSMQTEKGFFLNAGARFMLPIWRQYNQTITNNANTTINAKFDDLGVTVTNEVITGVLGAADYATKGKWAADKFLWHLLLTAELGWEWQLNNGHALGLGVYADVAPIAQKLNPTNVDLINVTAPQLGTPAVVKINSATDSYATKLHYFDAGLKFVYHFQFPKK